MHSHLPLPPHMVRLRGGVPPQCVLRRVLCAPSIVIVVVLTDPAVSPLCSIAKYAACSGECFVLALVYIDRIIKTNPTFVVNSLNIHRLLITRYNTRNAAAVGSRGLLQ